MVEGRIKKIAEVIKSFLNRHNIKLDKIVIFGSQAKGTFKDDSDVDIAIVSSDFEGKDIFQISEMLKGLKWEIIGEVMFPFDIVPISLKEWQESSSLIVEYIKEGKAILI